MEWAKLEYPLFAEVCPDEKLFCTAYWQGVVDAIRVPLDVRTCDVWGINEGDAARTAEQGGQLWGIRWALPVQHLSFPAALRRAGPQWQGVLRGGRYGLTEGEA